MYDPIAEAWRKESPPPPADEDWDKILDIWEVIVPNCRAYRRGSITHWEVSFLLAAVELGLELTPWLKHMAKRVPQWALNPYPFALVDGTWLWDPRLRPELRRLPLMRMRWIYAPLQWFDTSDVYTPADRIAFAKGESRESKTDA